MAERCEIAIVGGGIIGLATAAELVRRGADGVVLFEKERELGLHQTGRNSGVLHSGIYYRPGSAKAELCVRGGELMRAFCLEHGIALDPLGKVIVATQESELPALDELARRGRANGVEGLERIGPERLAEIEPHARGVAALHSPRTAIVDFPGVARRLADLAARGGVQIRTGVRLLGAAPEGDGLRLQTTAGELLVRHLVNCGGLHADRIARRSGERIDVRIIPFRGDYYMLRPEARELVHGLIYPVPDPAFPFLGVHFTRTLSGGVEAGPNAVLALAREGYGWGVVSPRDLLETLVWPGFRRMAARYWRTGLAEMRRSLSAEAFASALRALVPAVRAEDLVHAPAGVRAQAVDRSGRLLDDFEIVGGRRALHVLNAPSPAATASLAIAREIVDRAGSAFGASWATPA